MGGSLLERWTKAELVWPRRRPEVDADGVFYPAEMISTSTTSSREKADASFSAYCQQVYKQNGIVAACVAARMLPFAEVRFLVQEFREGRPGKLRWDASLGILERPWTNAQTQDLLMRMEQDVSLAGNFFAAPNRKGQLRRLRPDYVTILSGVYNDVNELEGPWDLDAEVVLYIYAPPGRTPVAITPARMVHYAPYPDPESSWRGMSWITPVAREVLADHYASEHKLRFFENGGTLGTVFSYDKGVTPRQFKQYVAAFDEVHTGVDNAYKALHVGGGVSPTVVGATMQQLDFKLTQGAGETRIAAAAGVGAVMAAFSEGLAGSSLNTGNYGAAKRKFGDMTIRPLWHSAAGSLEKLIGGVGDRERLWYDDRDVEFLKEDRKDAAEIQSKQATTMAALVQAGWTPDTVKDAVLTDDFDRLEHSGLFSIQLQRPGGGEPLGKALERLAAADPVLALALKVGARNSSADQALIQTAHDAIVAAGADCTLEEGT
jgi:phage portal protein BeeE